MREIKNREKSEREIKNREREIKNRERVRERD